MQYTDSLEQAAERARIALPLMSHNGIPASPDHYRVWYEYATGCNDALQQAIDQALKQHAVDSGFSAELYDRFFLDAQARIAEQMRTEVRQLVASMLEQLVTSGHHTDQYNSVLNDYSQRLEGELSSEEFRHLIREFLDETRSMQAANQSLQQRLQQTTRELDQLREDLDEARNEAVTDGLTGLPNRKAFDRALGEMTRNASGNDQSLCLIMADIDHFKQFNDNHGHLIGDKLLRFVAEQLQAMVKGQDLVARYGGEEFAILLPDTPLRGALAVAEQLRAGIQQQRLRKTVSGESIGSITLSLGVAEYRPGEDPEALIERADSALYHAKRFGRNRVTLENQFPAA